MNGRRWGAAAGAVVLAGAGAAFAATRSAGRTPAETPRPDTTVVRRTDLVDRQPFDGTLTYADTYHVLGHGGTLTWLPAEGAVIRRGGRAYAADGDPVPLLYGHTPLWRTLAEGVSDGPDVRELERNLAALGYGADLTVDDHFTAVTAARIRDWQHDRHRAETGTVAPSDVAVQPGAIRVTRIPALPGEPARGSLYTATSTRRVVLVDVPVAQQRVARAGARVRVYLPGGRATGGRVTRVGTVARAADSGDAAPPESGDQADRGTDNATIQVRVALDHPAGRLDRAPVTVAFTGEVRRDVLAVPVTALLARPGGGYLVRVVTGPGRHRDVPVGLGLFANGSVEVDGPGLAAGTRVEVAGS